MASWAPSNWLAGAPGSSSTRTSSRSFAPTPTRSSHDLDETESWDIVLDAEPALSPALSAAECDEALVAISRFVDLKSPYTLGHSLAVADLAAGAATVLGAPGAEVDLVRRSALVSRYGCLGVSNGIWDKRRPLSPSDWERIRLHPYLTERMLQRSPALASSRTVAVQLRERLDGSGYPRRPHRGINPSTGAAARRRRRVPGDARTPTAPARPAPDEAASELRGEARAGRLDGEAVEAVLGVAGHRGRAESRGRPASPAARSRSSDSSHAAVRIRRWRPVCVISPKTAGTHIEHIYAKLGVSSRAEAGLFAVQHGLLPEEPPDTTTARPTVL